MHGLLIQDQNHVYYRSSVATGLLDAYWANEDVMFGVTEHASLSNSHRSAAVNYIRPPSEPKSFDRIGEEEEIGWRRSRDEGGAQEDRKGKKGEDEEDP